MKYVIVLGNPVDGFRFIGPFDDHEEAIAVANNLDVDWWVGKLELDTEIEGEQNGQVV